MTLLGCFSVGPRLAISTLGNDGGARDARHTVRSERLACAHPLFRAHHTNTRDSQSTYFRTLTFNRLRNAGYHAGASAEARCPYAPTQDDRRQARWILLRTEHVVPGRTSVTRLQDHKFA